MSLTDGATMRKHRCSLPFRVIFNINNVWSKSQSPLETHKKTSRDFNCESFRKFGILKSTRLNFSQVCTSNPSRHSVGEAFHLEKRNLALVCDSFPIYIVFEALGPLGRFASYFGRRLDLIFLNGMLLSVSHYLGNVEHLAEHGLLAYQTV